MQWFLMKLIEFYGVFFGVTIMATINGTTAGEYLPGTDGNDTLVGGRGDDQLQGGVGSDVYEFYKGDGVDTYYDNIGSNVIVFKDVKSTELIGVDGLANGWLKLKYTAIDAISLANACYGTSYQPSSYQFSDGVALTHTQLLERFQVTFIGTNGDNYLLGTDGNDILIGGKGKDSLNGFVGDDTYYFYKGDGVDDYYDQIGSNVVIFEDVKSTDFVGVAFLSDQSLRLNYTATDSITIIGAGYDLSNQPSIYHFSDGVVWSAIELNARYWSTGNASNNSLWGANNNNDLKGLGGSDDIYGGGGNDTLTGGIGNDKLFGDVGAYEGAGSGGDDTYVFSKGDGIDTIYDSLGANKIVFSNLTSTDLLSVAIGNGYYNDDSLLIDYTAIDSIEIKNFTYSSNYQPTSYIFSDGITLTSAQLLNNYSVVTPNGQQWTGAITHDNFYGTTGNDIINGGKGDDYLSGQVGNDSYIFYSGDGNDTIVDWQGKNSITFGDMALADISFEFNAADLLIKYSGGAITLNNYFSARNPSFDLLFSDGTYIDEKNFRELIGVQYWVQALDDLSGIQGGVDYNNDGVVNFCFLETNANNLNGWSAFSEAQKAVARQVIADLQRFSNLRFVETTNSKPQETILFQNSTSITSGAAGVGGSNGQGGGEVTLLNTTIVGYSLIAHELGHALGLMHQK